MYFIRDIHVRHAVPPSKVDSLDKTVRCRFNAVNYIKRIHKRRPIARPLGRRMGCFLCIQPLIDILPQFLQWCLQYFAVLDRIITLLDCMLYSFMLIEIYFGLCQVGIIILWQLPNTISTPRWYLSNESLITVYHQIKCLIFSMMINRVKSMDDFEMLTLHFTFLFSILIPYVYINWYKFIDQQIASMTHDQLIYEIVKHTVNHRFLSLTWESREYYWLGPVLQVKPQTNCLAYIWIPSK